MNLLPVFEWLDGTSIGEAIRNSMYIFPVVEVLHLFGLTVLLGTLTLTNMRMLGIGMRRQSVAAVAGQLAPYTIGGAVVTILSGIFLFLSEALKCYGNAAFPWKMGFLLGGLLVYLLFQRRITAPGARVSNVQLKIVAVLSLALWYGVAIAGRAIAFV